MIDVQQTEVRLEENKQRIDISSIREDLTLDQSAIKNTIVSDKVSRSRILESNYIAVTEAQWITLRCFIFFFNKTIPIIKKLRSVPWLYAVVSVRFGAVIIMTGLGVAMAFLSPHHIPTYGMLVLFLTLQLSMIILNSYSIYTACTKSMENDNFFLFFFSLVLGEIIVCPILAIFADSSLGIYIDIMFIAFILINIFYEIILVVWLCISPFLIILLLWEIVFLACRGELRCPKKSRITVNIDYTAFLYHPTNCPESLCAICRASFTLEDYLVCLKCSESHIFHEECIFQALKVSPYCPICRQIAKFQV